MTNPKAAIHDWIKTDLNVAAQMTITPDQVQKLVARFAALSQPPQAGTGDALTMTNPNTTPFPTHSVGDVWCCKIGSRKRFSLPGGSDAPMRQAVERAFRDITGEDAEFTFSGWSAELTEGELAVVENRPPHPDYIASLYPSPPPAPDTRGLEPSAWTWRQRMRDTHGGFEDACSRREAGAWIKAEDVFDLEPLVTLASATAIIAERDARIEKRDRQLAGLSDIITELETRALTAEAEVARLRRALEPFVALADKFTGPMVEVCDPHPDNPSHTIQPFATMRFHAARAALTKEPAR